MFIFIGLALLTLISNYQNKQYRLFRGNILIKNNLIKKGMLRSEIYQIIGNSPIKLSANTELFVMSKRLLNSHKSKYSYLKIIYDHNDKASKVIFK